MQKAVAVDKLAKSYGKIKAVDEVSFSVDKGDIFGLIGPDGAGKSTLIRMLNTLIVQDSGTAEILNYDTVKEYRKIRDIMGYMPGKFSLYPDLTIEENLKLFAAVFETTIDENYGLIQKIYSQLEPFKDRPAGKLSGGMKQKLALSCALIHAPEILFLDEPTTGVDPVSRKEFWEMLYGLKDRGITIIVSTPYMDEASKCSRIGLMQEGRIMGIDTPEGIKKMFEGELYAISGNNRYAMIKSLESWDRSRSVHAFGDSIHFMPEPETSEGCIKSYLDNKGLSGYRMQRIEPGIEDVFMSLMGKE